MEFIMTNSLNVYWISFSVTVICCCLTSPVLACPEGLYGENCSQPCNCKDNTTCNAVNGACRSGCPYGFTGLSCSMVLPTLTLPPTVFIGEECGTTTITWTRGDFSNLDSRIILDSYQIDYKKAGEIKWSTHKKLIKHNDSVDQYSWVISNLTDRVEYLFRVNIRVSEYGEISPEYTLGPISDPVILQCNKFTAENTSSYTRDATSYITPDPFMTITTATEQKPTETRDTTTTTHHSMTKTASKTQTTQQPTTATSRQQTNTVTAQPFTATTQSTPTTTRTEIKTTTAKTQANTTTAPYLTTLSRTTRHALMTTELTTTTQPSTTTKHSATGSTITTTDELTLLNGELELMIQNLTAKLEPQLRFLFITWQLDDRYMYLMKSGALFFGMIGIGDCYVSPVIDWASYPLSMYIRHIRVPGGEDWRIYNIRIEYYQHTSNEPTESVGNVTISSITSNSVHIKWITPSCMHRGSDVISYTCTLSETNTANKIKLETQLTLIQIDRLKPFTNYSTVVTIKNDIGSGPSSSPIAFRTLEDVPGPPTIIKLTPLLNTAIVVDFAPPIDANGLITKYRLSVKEEMTSYQIEIDTDVTSATINDLSAYTSYHVKVKARTSIGWGSFSNVRTVRTLEDVPGNPENFSMIFQDETTIGLQWTSPNFTTGTIHGYKLSYHRGTEDSERVVIYGSHSALSQVNVTDLDSGEYYHFRVQARSGAGYGPSVNKTSFTLPARPEKPAVPIISYSNQQLTLKLFPNIVDEKHFYMARVYADDVSLKKASIPEVENEPTGTVILIMDKIDIKQNVIYILGDNSTRHGIHNVELHFNHTYVFYLEIVTRFENIIRFNFVKHPEYFTISLINTPVEGSSDDENVSDLSGIAVGIVFGIIVIPAAALICIATKRSDKDTCTSTTTTKSKYGGNRETNVWPKNGNIGRSNSMQSTDFRHIKDLGNDSNDVNTCPPVQLTHQNENINRSTSFQRTHLKNNRRQNTNRGNIKRSLSDTEMNQKNNLYRAYDVTITKSSTVSAQRAQTWHTKNNIVNNEDIIEGESNSTAPPKPPRHRLRRSNTGSRFEELNRRTCSPIPEEALPEVTQRAGIDRLCSKMAHRPKYQPELNGNFIRDIEYNTNRVGASNFNVNEIGTQTLTEGDAANRKRVKRKRRILASKAMSENRSNKITIDGRSAKQSNDVKDLAEYQSQYAIQSENYCYEVSKSRKRKRPLKRNSESMMENKTFEHAHSLRSLSFSEGTISQYRNSGVEINTFPDAMDIKDYHDQMKDVTNVNSVNTSFHGFGMRKKSRSFCAAESSIRGEFRDQDVLKFWSKTYSFLDERKIIPHDVKFEEHKVTSFFESDRPQTVSLELEFRSLPTGVLGTTNVARQKAGVHNHKLWHESYDHSRVVLKPEGPDDYINASYIKDRIRDGSPRYIVAQTPHDAVSAVKFWRMVLQERTRVIVKLSQQPDIFPSVINQSSGLVTERFQVSHSEDISLHGCLVRYIKITNVLDHTSRGVYIIHDLMWPDDDRFYLPHDKKEFISMRNVVRKCSGTCSAPVIVHCSREDGRSGVFISVDALILEYEKQREVNIFSFVRNMLKDRYGMVKTIWQYRFIYEALLEANSQS